MNPYNCDLTVYGAGGVGCRYFAFLDFLQKEERKGDDLT
jgi:hypothetical protein